ncbi:unnamed protein product [Periconia digitata]|uniref:Amino acid transporter n=1 Tax=Periconia digitata TaxID=1303443 RepID=A0A9W4UG00_9PLEO|nr:unnamed protein product [Periconia digitata]
MAGRYANPPPTRDSLELASLASSSHVSQRTSIESSESGARSSQRLSFDDEDPLSELNPAGHDENRPRHNRSYSVSSAFDFAPNLFPLSSTAQGYTALGAPSNPALDPSNALNGGASLEKNKSLTYLNGLSLVVGLIIGSGIFSSPSQVNRNAGSPGASLLVWAIAGILAWTGAASYAELGGAIPLNGGAQVYLSKIFGEWAGFLFTWCAVVVLKPGSAAIIAIIFGEYIVRAFMGPDALEAVWLNKGVGLAGLVVVTLLNCISTKLGTRSADVFMFLKFVALLGVTIIGIVVAVTGFSYTGEANDDWKTKGWFEGTSTNISNWAVALYSGLWAFDGWDNVNYVTGEFKNPAKDLPRVIHTSLPLVILCYIMANVAYFLVLPTSLIESSNAIAVAFGHQVFGPIGSFILALFVSGSCFGALNATTFTSSRLVYAAGKEGYLPSVFGSIGLGKSHRAVRLHTLNANSTPKSKISSKFIDWFADADAGFFFTPISAMLLNAGLTAVYIFVGSFDTLVTFYGVAGYSFYFLAVLGLIVLRVKEPELERPYRTWITTPIIFCCVSLFLLSRAVFAEPVQTLVVVAFMVVGLVVWFGWVGRRRNKEERRFRRIGGDEDEKVGWKFWRRWRS